MNWISSLLAIVKQVLGFVPAPPKAPAPEKTETPADLGWVEPAKADKDKPS
jgi:hypothetical protein